MALTKISRSLLDTGISDSSDATAITIDSSENVGTAARLSVGTTTVGGGNTKIVATGGSDNYLQLVSSTGTGGVSLGNAGSVFLLYTHTGALGSESFTERMRIDSAGHLLVGTTSEYSGTNGNITVPLQLDIGANDANLKTLFFNRNAAEGEIGGIAAGVTGFSTMGRINFVAEGVAGGSQSSSIRFKTTESATESERMRIASNGRLLLNKTSSQSTPARFDVTRSSGEHAINTFVNSTSNSTIVAFWNTNGIVGTINTSGSATSYNTSSDARLKNVTGEAKGLEIINNLKPVEFEWKSSGEKADGLIAQEVEEVFPQAVSAPELDGEWYSVDYSKLVTPLIKGMQEQQKQIEELKKEIETLKN